ncbi:MAG: hypothetical protein SYNGOMJ08_00237 [Candidatus Syntrophoarchaeum sp. GoM_oil]|nr:MAG: hypothetical protein SYNGOMJ08_00237 [Candidatus Syntrophoarchaeum sp. GoM_oil]
MDIEDELLKYSKEELVEFIRLSSKLFMAMDGFWFIAAKEKLGYKTALELDRQAWEMYFPYEAKKLKSAFNLDQGIDGAIRGLKHSMRLLCLDYSVTEMGQDKAILAVRNCHIKRAMERENTPFTCQKVGNVVLPLFLKIFDDTLDGEVLLDDTEDDDVSCRWVIGR